MPPIKANRILVFFLCLLPLLATAQEGLADILNSSNNFDVIVKNGEQYFKTKHPNLSFNELTEGEFRDGEFVKFMRQKH